MFKKYISLIFILLAFFKLSAQEPLSIHLTEKDGLPDIEFYDLLEDNKGFIWLAADKGLYRYNGREYKLFNHPLKRGRSLFGLKTDDKGRIWCNNLAGQFFYVEDNKLILYKDFPEINTLIDYYFYKNYLVLCINNKMICVDINTKNIVKTIENSPNLIIDNFRENFNKLFIAKDNSFQEIDSIYLPSKTITKLQEDKNFKRGSKFIFKLNNKKYLFEQSEKQYLKKITEINTKGVTNIEIPKQLEGIKISKITFNGDTAYFISNKGIFFTTIVKNQLHLKDHYFKNEFITDFLIDKNKNLWFSTLKNGIFVVSNPEIKTQTNAKFKNIVTTIKKDENTLFLATDTGIILEYNYKKNKLKKLNYSSLSGIKQLYYNNVNNQLLISNSNSTTVYNLQNNTSFSFKSSSWKSIDLLKNNTYLVSTPNSFVELDVVKKQRKDLIEKRTYASLFSREDNNYYATIIDGFAKYSLSSKSIEYPLYKNKKIYGSILEKTADSTLWITTHSKGLLAYKNNTFIDSLVLSNGLASTIINEVKADKNTLWISTDKGLQEYDYFKKKIRTLTKTDGLASYSINSISILDSIVFLTTNKDFISFNKNKAFKEKQVPKLYFTNLEVQNKNVEIPAKLVLKQDESNFKIQFNSNGFQSKQNVIYEYYLDGFSNTWTTIQTGINFVNFNTLPFGNFIFKVRGRNKYENNYSEEITLPIEVQKPYYKSLFFIIFVISVLFLLLYIYFKKQNLRLRKEQEVALEKAQISQELVFSQLENLRSQMNPHFIFNALNSIQDFIILNEKKLARQYLVKFSKLIRIYLEHSQKQEITLAEEIKALNIYLELEKDRFNDDFEFTITIEKDIKTEAILLPSLFLQPYVENALKHGLLHKKDNKKLKINFSEENDTLFCTIEDNGVGRKIAAEINKKKTNKHVSFATSANQKRVHLLNMANNSNLEIFVIDLEDNKQALGTKVLIKIPIKF